MAKKAKTVPVVEDVVEYEDGGIYWREQKVGERTYSITTAEQAEILTQAGDYAAQLAAELDLVERSTADSTPSDDTEYAKYLIRELRAVISHGADCDALLLAYRLGRLAEKLQVLPFEPLVRESKSRKPGQRSGGEKRRKFKTPEAEASAVTIVARYYNPPAVRKTTACRRAVPDVLTELGVESNERTLLRLWNKSRA